VRRQTSVDFVRALAGYVEQRDRPALPGTSRLSPHLHFGEIGPRQIAWRLNTEARDRAAAEAYLRQLYWREFAHHVLHHAPYAAEQNLDRRFDAFPYAPPEPVALRRWQLGETGIPIIDAGMRQLWTTGWMHNRVRMLVASFLTKNLRLHWRHGARWFWDTLVDADLANNTQGWQWAAGCGVDAAPYFRIFNPVTQAERFDPDGSYVRRWVPEPTQLPAPWIHQPWAMRGGEPLAYPSPMVDLAASRAAALAAYRRMRGGSD
jgi:deoxyribodipyrimidine photo-lyase